jgi:Tol biopolymer transport system component
MPACPRADRLLRLLADDLPQREHEELVAHLDNCAGCQDRLEVLAARSGLWNDLSLLRDDRLDPPTCEWRDEAGSVSPDDDELPIGLLEPADEPGSLGRLGSYDVLRLIGRGGMGMVFLARDRALDRLVAIKLLTPGMAATGAARRRFAREAKAAAAVVHDHVVTIHAVDTLPQGIPYLVMQYIPGKSVQELIDRGKTPELAEILRIGSQAASALAAAHAQGLIHRDIKPANILLENGVERVKITDFGLARAVDDATMTQSGVVAGTPQYMSPEQARGEAIDHRTDLFSLGSVLYAICVGRAPFRGNSSMATLKRVCEHKPEPIQALNPEIPTWLIKIIERLHAKDPAERFDSAAEVADLLGRCLAHVQQPASVPLPAELAPVSRRPILALWGAIPVCLVVAALMGLSTVREAAGQAVNYVATVLRLKTPEGTLVVETEDPNIGIKLDGSELVVTGAGVKELRVAVGQHNVQAVKDGKILRDELVTINRGDRKVLTVHREPDDAPPMTGQVAAPVPPEPPVAPEVAELLATGPSGGMRAAKARELARAASPRRVVTATMANTNPVTPRRLVELEGADAEVRTVCFSPDGRLLAYGDKSGKLNLCDWPSHPGGGRFSDVHSSISAHAGGVESVAFAPDGKTLVSAGWDHHVKLWDLQLRRGSEPVWDFAGFSDGVRSVAFSPDGTLVAAGGFDRVLIVLDARTGMRVWTSPTLEQPVNGVAFSPHGRMLAMALGDYSKGTPGDLVGQPGEVQLWSWPGREKLAGFGGWTRECKSVAFSPDGRLLAATSGDGTTRLYRCDPRSADVEAILQSGPFTAGVAFRPDGRQLATSNWAGEVRLWSLKGPAILHWFQAHEQNIPCIAFSPDGQYLATASADHSVKVWDLREPTATPPPPAAEKMAAESVQKLAELLKRQSLGPRESSGPGKRLYMRDLAEGRTTMIADPAPLGGPFAEMPDWSHDGRRIVFHVQPRLNDWSRSHVLLIQESGGRPISRDLGAGCCPKFSPDDRTIAFVLLHGEVPRAQEGIWLMDSDGSNRRRLAEFGAPFWSPDGSQLLINDLSTPTESKLYSFATGHLESIRIPGKFIFSWPSWAGPNTLVASAGGRNEPDSIVLLDVSQPSEAKVTSTLWNRSTGPDAYARWPIFSPSTGDYFFIGVERNRRTLYALSPGGGPRGRLSSLDVGSARLSAPSLSPDGRYLLFVADGLEGEATARTPELPQNGTAREVARLSAALKANPPRHSAKTGERMQLYMRDLAGGTTSLIADEPVPGLSWTGSPDWSPDGTRIVFDTSRGKDWINSRLIVMEDRDGKPSFSDLGPGNCAKFSPDDRQIAFLLNPGAVPDEQEGVYLMRADGSDRRRIGGFGAPFWSERGQDLLINGFSEPTECEVYSLSTGRHGKITVPEQRIFSWPRWAGPERLVACIGPGEEPDSIVLLDVSRPPAANVVRTLWKRSPELDVYARWPLYSPSSGICYFVGVAGNKRTLYAVKPGDDGRAVAVEGQGHEDELGGLTFSPDGRYLLFGANRPDRAAAAAETRETGLKSAADEADRLAAQLKQHPPRSSRVDDPLRLFLFDRQDRSVTLVADEPDTGSNHVGSPRWSHDGKRILFDSMPGNEYDKLRIKAIERGPDSPRLTDLGPGACPAWSPDDREIAILLNPGAQPATEPGIWVMNADGTDRRPFQQFGMPFWSPSGRVLLFGSFSEPRPISVVDLRQRSAASRPLRLPRWKIHSWPSWAGLETLVAVIGTEQTWNAVALIEVSPLGAAKVQEVLWNLTPALDLKPSWPVYSHATGRCTFVGETTEGMALYEIERGKPGVARRLERGPLDTRIAGLCMAPGGRYVLFCSTRSVPPTPEGASGPDPEPAFAKPAAAAERLAEVLRRHPPRPSVGQGTRMQLYLRDLKRGDVTPIADEPISGLTRTSSPNWSHDGTRIAFHATPDNDWGQSRMIVLWAKNGQPATLDIGAGSCPAYSPDDRQIAFLVWPGRNKGERPGTYLMDADGTNRLLVGNLGAPYWSPDGDTLLLNPFSEPTHAQILDLASGRASTIRLAGHHLMSWPRWVGRDRVIAVICEGEGEQNAALAILDVSNPSEATVREVLWKRGPDLDVLPRWPLHRASTDEYLFVGVAPANHRNLFLLSPGSGGRATPLQAQAQADQLEGLFLSPGERYLLFNANRRASP